MTNHAQASEEQIHKASQQYPGEWWHHKDGLHQPVLVVVGAPGAPEPPPPSSAADPVWRSPDGRAPVMVLDQTSYDVWYRDAEGRLLRAHDTRQ